MRTEKAKYRLDRLAFFLQDRIRYLMQEFDKPDLELIKKLSLRLARVESIQVSRDPNSVYEAVKMKREAEYSWIRGQLVAVNGFEVDYPEEHEIRRRDYVPF